MSDNVERARRAYFLARGGEETLGYWTEDCVFEDFPDVPDRDVSSVAAMRASSRRVGSFVAVWTSREQALVAAAASL